VIDEEIPWPANTGKRLRTLNLLTCLAAEFQMDMLVHANAATPEARDEMRRRGIAVRVSDSRIPEKGGLLLPVRIVASVAAGLPYSVYSHYQAGYRRALEDALRREQYALVHCEWTPYAIYTTSVTHPVCVAAHNVEWAIWQRMTLAETRPVHKRLFALQAALMKRFEHRVFAGCRHATAVSDGDAEIIRSLGCREVTVIPNGVDAEMYSPPGTDTPAPRSLVFTGSMDWRANQDAIRWFIDAVHPILSRDGDYRLHVVGRTPPAWMLDRAVMPLEIIATGTVDDVRPYIADAAVYVVPLRVGGGSRLKILEAFSMGRAVVSTTVGAEGLDVESGKHLLLEDTAEGFASAVTALWRDAGRRRALGMAGRTLIEERYRWEQIAPRQGEVWLRAIADAG
jgi:glycosyltransferase involved in cell wall biosynthesis